MVPPTVWVNPTTVTLLLNAIDSVGVVTFTGTDAGWYPSALAAILVLPAATGVTLTFTAVEFAGMVTVFDGREITEESYPLKVTVRGLDPVPGLIVIVKA